MTISSESRIKYVEFHAPLEKLFSEMHKWISESDEYITPSEVTIQEIESYYNKNEWYGRIYFFDK